MHGKRLQCYGTQGGHTGPPLLFHFGPVRPFRTFGLYICAANLIGQADPAPTGNKTRSKVKAESYRKPSSPAKSGGLRKKFSQSKEEKLRFSRKKVWVNLEF